jgi:hypothetical protein
MKSLEIFCVKKMQLSEQSEFCIFSKISPKFSALAIASPVRSLPSGKTRLTRFLVRFCQDKMSKTLTQ